MVPSEHSMRVPFKAISSPFITPLTRENELGPGTQRLAFDAQCPPRFERHAHKYRLLRGQCFVDVFVIPGVQLDEEEGAFVEIDPDWRAPIWIDGVDRTRRVGIGAGLLMCRVDFEEPC